MAKTLTVMAVTDRPDGQASRTGGLLAACPACHTWMVAAASAGGGPGGITPGGSGHDRRAGGAVP